MGPMRILLVGCAPGNHASEHHQCRTIVRLLECFDGATNLTQVICIFHNHRIPSHRFETLGDIFSKGQIRIAFNRDTVVIIDPTKIG